MPGVRVDFDFDASWEAETRDGFGVEEAWGPSSSRRKSAADMRGRVRRVEERGREEKSRLGGREFGVDWGRRLGEEEGEDCCC